MWSLVGKGGGIWNFSRGRGICQVRFMGGEVSGSCTSTIRAPNDSSMEYMRKSMGALNHALWIYVH